MQLLYFYSGSLKNRAFATNPHTIDGRKPLLLNRISLPSHKKSCRLYCLMHSGSSRYLKERSNQKYPANLKITSLQYFAILCLVLIYDGCQVRTYLAYIFAKAKNTCIHRSRERCASKEETSNREKGCNCAYFKAGNSSQGA